MAGRRGRPPKLVLPEEPGELNDAAQEVALAIRVYCILFDPSSTEKTMTTTIEEVLSSLGIDSKNCRNLDTILNKRRSTKKPIWEACYSAAIQQDAKERMVAVLLHHGVYDGLPDYMKRAIERDGTGSASCVDVWVEPLAAKFDQLLQMFDSKRDGAADESELSSCRKELVDALVHAVRETVKPGLKEDGMKGSSAFLKAGQTEGGGGKEKEKDMLEFLKLAATTQKPDLSDLEESVAAPPSPISAPTAGPSGIKRGRAAPSPTPSEEDEEGGSSINGSESPVRERSRRRSDDHKAAEEGAGGSGASTEHAQPQVTTTTSTATQTTEVGQQQQQPAAVHTPKPYRWEEERAELKMALADEQGKAFLLEEEVRDLREQLEDFQKAALAAAHYPVPAPAAGVAAIDHAASQQPNQGAAFGPRGFVGLMTKSSFFNDALVDFLTVPDVFGCRVSRDLNHVVLTGWERWESKARHCFPGLPGPLSLTTSLPKFSLPRFFALSSRMYRHITNLDVQLEQECEPGGNATARLREALEGTMLHVYLKVGPMRVSSELIPITDERALPAMFGLPHCYHTVPIYDDACIGRNALHPLSLATGRLIISAVDTKGRAALLFRTKLQVGSNLSFEQHNTTAVVSLSRAWSEFWNDAAPLKVGAKVKLAWRPAPELGGRLRLSSMELSLQACKEEVLSVKGDRFSSEPLLCLSAGHKLMALQRVLAPLLWFSTPSAGPEGEEQDELEQAEG